VRRRERQLARRPRDERRPHLAACEINLRQRALAKVLGGEALVALLPGALALAEHDLDHGHALARRLDTT